MEGHSIMVDCPMCLDVAKIRELLHCPMCDMAKVIEPEVAAVWRLGGFAAVVELSESIGTRELYAATQPLPSREEQIEYAERRWHELREEAIKLELEKAVLEAAAIAGKEIEDLIINGLPDKGIFTTMGSIPHQPKKFGR